MGAIRVVLFGLAVLGACAIESALVPCGDRLCPATTSCVADALCATQAQIDACVDVEDGATCDLAGGVGRCDRGACIAANCGNGVEELGEACDDGNAESGDGCRGDCGKLEMCGDGVADAGEACDDGNDNGADGCDACVATTWQATVVIGGNLTAAAVALENPGGIAFDHSGNLYIADTSQHRVRRVEASGIVTTVAGTGASGFGGDGGPATSAALAHPSAVAVDGLGNVFIADSSNGRIRRVDASGTITTLAGTGAAGSGGDGGPATSAELYSPQGVAVDGLGNVYVADTYNHRVRRVDLAGTITTIAGTGTGGFSGDGGPAVAAQLRGPYDVTLDGAGNLYVADATNHRVRRIDAAGMISTAVGNGTGGAGGDGGPATAAQLAGPEGVTVGDDGALYIADRLNHRVRRVDTSGTITTIAGSGAPGDSGDGGVATSALLSHPWRVAVDAAGDVYVSDQDTHRVRRVDAAGIISTWAGTGAVGYSGDGGAATSAALLSAASLAADGAGNLYIADSNHHRIRRVDPTGVITTIAGTGMPGYLGDGGAAIGSPLQFPRGIAIDGAGALYVADTHNHRIRRVGSSGVIETIAGTGTAGFSGDGGPATGAQLDTPSGLAFDGLGNLYVADRVNNRIRRVDPAGVITTVAGTGTAGFAGDGGLATSAQLRDPYSIALDAGGNLYIADTVNRRIRRVDQVTRIITTIAGSGLVGPGTVAFSGDGGPATSAELGPPQDVTLDGAGNVYIADSSNHRIRRVDGTGTINTIAGTDAGTTGGFDGDGGAATDAMLAYPSGIAFDANGTLFISDRNNRAIRRVDAGIITTVTGAIDPEGMGPLDLARLADPQALARTPAFTLVAGGSSGTVQAARETPGWLEVVAGRYPQPTAAAGSARFQSDTFGAVGGVAYDAANGVIFVAHANRIDAVTVIDVDDSQTWLLTSLANAAGLPGFADGTAAAARFRDPSGLYFDETTRQLYVADTGNHTVRAIDLSSGAASATVRTVAGTPQTRGFFGDGNAATGALLFGPRAITRCNSGDLFIADTGNHRVRRVELAIGTITTVLGDGVATSSGEGRPATSFPVHAPLGLACDATGNLFVSSTTAVRLVPSIAGIVDGSGGVQTIYGAPPRTTFPASVTRCLSGLVVVDATTVHVADSCTGLLVQLRRSPTGAAARLDPVRAPSNHISFPRSHGPAFNRHAPSVPAPGPAPGPVLAPRRTRLPRLRRHHHAVPRRRWCRGWGSGRCGHGLDLHSHAGAVHVSVGRHGRRVLLRSPAHVRHPRR